MRRAEGNGDGECTSATRSAFHADGSAMELRELLHQGQSDPGPLVGAGACIFDAVKALENAGTLVAGDADARIADGQLDGTAGGLEGELDFPFKSKFEGIGEKVEDDLLPHLAIDIDEFVQPGAMDDE